MNTELTGIQVGTMPCIDFVECQICKEPFTRIMNSHLRKIHGIAFEEYRNRFPGALTTCLRTGWRMSKNQWIRKGQVQPLIVRCGTCGKRFQTSTEAIRLYKTHHCSRKCRDKSYEKRELMQCSYCGKGIIRGSSEVGKYYCNNECKKKGYSKYFSGANSSAWKGGISFQEYSRDFIKGSLTVTVRIIHEYKCGVCAKHEEELGYTLHTHHIDYNKQNNTKKNLVPLCRKCHSKTNWNRDYWKNYFTEEYENAINN